MKILKYNICTPVNRGTMDKPEWEDVLTPVKMTWNEKNEIIAKTEAYNGEYSIEEGCIDVPAVASVSRRVAELEEALELLLSGVTE